MKFVYFLNITNSYFFIVQAQAPPLDIEFYWFYDTCSSSTKVLRWLGSCTINNYGLVMYRFCSKLICLSKPVQGTDNSKTKLAYYEICLFSVYYEFVLFYSAGPRGQISPSFFCPKQSNFCANNFRCFPWQQHLTKLWQNMALDANAVAKNMLLNFSANIGEAVQHVLCHLLYP
jgi:hypothetical protein